MSIQDQAFLQLRKKIEALVKLQDAEWQMFIPHLAIEKINKNKLFVKEGKKTDKAAFVLSGSLRQYYTKDGEEKTTYFYFENHFMASYISCITQTPSLLSIEALTDVEYVAFPYSALNELYDKSMAWQKFGRLMAEYLSMGLEERMVGLLLQSPEERYIELMSSNKNKIIERIPHHYIASYLGITPVSLSRIRNRILTKKK